MKLSKKILLIFIISLVLTVSLILVVGFSYGTNRVRKVVEGQQLDSTIQLMNAVDRIMYERYLDIETISSLVIFQDFLINKENASLKKNAEYLLDKLLSTSGPWDELYIFNDRGEVEVSSDKTGANYAFNEETKKAYQTALGGKIYYSDVVEMSGKVTVIFAAPIIDRNTFGKPINGVTMGYYSWPVIEELLGSVKDYKVSLMNTKGVHIYGNGKVSALDDVSHQSHPVIKKALKEKNGVTQLIGVHSELPSLLSFVLQKGFLQYSGSDWILIMETPMSALNASVLGVIVPIIIVFLIISVLSPLILYFVIRGSVIVPMSRLTETAKSIQSGDFNARAIVVSKDEFGELGKSFNGMAARIQNLYTGMEQKINERTESLDKNFQLLKEKNEALDKNKSAMLNILEDDKMLELALKEEKENVERKVVERTMELSNTKARLDSSIENLPLGFLMVDIEEKLVVTNTLAKNILGKKDNAANLLELKELLKDKIDLSEYIKNCGKEKKRQDFSDIEINGKYFHFLLSPILTKEIKESCIGVVVLIQDITEAKILERSKDEFFSIASHELRTPLTAIRGNTSMILEYYAEAIKDPELKAMVDDIHESSIRLINIVNDFLNVSRLEQSRMEFDIKEFDLDQIIKETLKEYDVTGSRKKLSLDYDELATPLPKVLGDGDKVRQVLINLVGNSLKFTTEGGVKITTEVSDKFVKVFVSDTGRGIPLKQQSLLFHKFQQAGASLFTRDTAGGSGLGLYISRMMLEGMGGEVKLERSEEGKGSTFSFSIPIAVTKK